MPRFARIGRALVLAVLLAVPAVVALSSSPAAAQQVQTPAPGTVPPCVYNPVDFANAFLNAISMPTTSDNIEAIMAWERAEGGNWENTAKFNPLDTTWPGGGQSYDGSTSMNSVNVQAYKDWDDGVYATAMTITDDGNYPDSFTQDTGYDNVMSALAAGNNAANVTNAVDNSEWGTSNATGNLGEPYNPSAPSWESPCIGSPAIFVDPGSALDTYWYTSGSWYSAPIAGSGVDSASAALNQTDGAPTVFVEGVGNSLMNYWYVPAGGGWGAATIAGGGSTFSAPAALAQPDGTPSVFVEGPSNSLLNYWYIPAQGTWGAATVAGPGSAFSAPAVVAQQDGAPSLFVEGPAGSLVNYWYAASSGTWDSHVVSAPGTIAGGPAATLQSANGSPTVFVEGTGGSLMNYWYIPAPGIWGAATVVGPGSTTSTPAVMLQSGGAPTIFVQTPGNDLLNYWYIPAQGGWGSGTVAGGGAAQSGPSVVPQSNGAPSVIVEGAGGSVMNYWYVPQGGYWGLGTVAGPNSTATSAGILQSANLETNS
ncbi:MAG TPA: hypothetical protein VEG62_00795 [Acidimicrobiales bacterium]|nr:hypothetical protein [Acidimicrobiales bacterium]